MREFVFNGVYELATLIEGTIIEDCPLYSLDLDNLIKTSAKFCKKTLLHQYIKTVAFQIFEKEFVKSNWYDEPGALDYFYEQFNNYHIKIPKYEHNGDLSGYDWFSQNTSKFERLLDKQADEVFFILFSNRGFLLKFNMMISNLIENHISLFPEKYLTKNKKIKRVYVPTWVKTAIFHRDKGKCVFCFKDLTGLINIKNKINYDHMVALDDYGSNDPCNIQLSCESCNKQKNSYSKTSMSYIPWW